MHSIYNVPFRYACRCARPGIHIIIIRQNDRVIIGLARFCLLIISFDCFPFSSLMQTRRLRQKRSELQVDLVMFGPVWLLEGNSIWSNYLTCSFVSLYILWYICAFYITSWYYYVRKHCEHILKGCFRLKYFHEADLPGFMSKQPVFAGFRFLHLDGDRCWSPGPWASSQIFTGCPGIQRWGSWNFYLKRVNGGVDEKWWKIYETIMFIKDAESKKWFRIFFCKGNLHLRYGMFFFQKKIESI